ncbi:MAG: hypothetical protein OJF50_005825 [Nitrospira sp.]|nr:hypothetical protein [Nitrospira sp.]
MHLSHALSDTIKQSTTHIQTLPYGKYGHFHHSFSYQE